MKTKKFLKIFFLYLIFLFFSVDNLNAQDNVWNNKKCAVVLTYDDALNIHLDNVIPLLDSLNFKGTFYVYGLASGFRERLKDWAVAASKGHELGNHTLFHPCIGNMKGREWVQEEYDLNTYSLKRIEDEILMNNVLLEAVDGQKVRTFAYPCGDMKAGDSSYVDFIKNEFIAARGVNFLYQKIDEIDLFNIGCIFINNHSGSELIDFVKKAIAENALIVFLFHGVGGEHSINVSSEAHRQLLKFLKENEKNIWVAPLKDVAEFIKQHQSKAH